MSKPVKELIRREVVGRLEGVTSMAVVNFTGIDANTTNAIRNRLREKEIRLNVVKNSIARQAMREVGLEGATDLLDGPCALAWGSDSVVTVVRELLDIKKESAPNLSVKAAYMDGETFDTDRIEELSKYPTRDEAIAQLVGCVLAGGSNLSGCLVGPGGQLAGILKSIEEKDEGEAA
ncbi:MAG: 50S ribosomal protein L10 [Phycisphaerae bacterium]